MCGKMVRIWFLCMVLFFSSGSIAQFSPMDIDGCVLWLDAADESTVRLASNGRVILWADKSGYGGDFERVAGVGVPVMNKEGIGGQASLEFKGSEALVALKAGQFDFLHKGGGVSVFAVFESTEEHPRKYMAVMGNGGDDKNNVGFVMAFNDSDVFHENNAFAAQVSNGDGFTVNIRRLRGDDNYALAPLRPNVVSFMFQADGNKQIAQAYVSGQKITNDVEIGTPSLLGVSQRLAIGAADQSGRLGFVGKIAQIVVYNRLLDDEQRQQVEQWLIEKYSIKPLPKVILDKRCQRVELTKQPDAIENDGTLLAIEAGALYESRDGITWTVRSENLIDKAVPSHTAGGIMTVTPKGTIVSFAINKTNIVKLNYKDRKFNSDEATYPVYSMRSIDGGRNWTDCGLLQAGYCGAMRGLIVTKQGHIVLCVQKWDVKNERHITTVYVSDDEGKTYKCSEVDNGIGWGLHDGFFESTITELSDGRLWILGRTSLGVFWQAYSADGGYSWSTPQPTTISAGGYPGYLLRLSNGRVVLVWNRFYPDGGEDDKSLVGMASTSWFWGKQPTSRFSRELSIMFSRDDGKSWSKPLVLVEGVQDNVRLAYPKMMEIGEGNIYIWAGIMATKINEKDFD